MDGREPVVIDTSTLINFLAVGRVDLLARHPKYRFVVTEHARAEVTDHFPEQLERMNAGFAAGALEETPVTALNELQTFAALAADGRLGDGECASIAAASKRGVRLAMDDKTAVKRALAFDPTLRISNTQDLVVSLIREGLLDVRAADAMKAEWAVSYRFVLKLKSFGDLV